MTSEATHDNANNERSYIITELSELGRIAQLANARTLTSHNVR